MFDVSAIISSRILNACRLFQFYHACDNGTLYTLCILDYSVLQYCDFYGSIYAVWVTAMALSELPDSLRSFLHIAGCLGILIGTQITLSGIWSFVIPVVIAVVILSTSWVRPSPYPRPRVGGWCHSYVIPPLYLMSAITGMEMLAALLPVTRTQSVCASICVSVCAQFVLSKLCFRKLHASYLGEYRLCKCDQITIAYTSSTGIIVCLM